MPIVKALVPMKGHSERVPNKNMRILGGRPLFHWILEALTKSKYINEIIINTDSEEIAENAKKNFKVTIIKRPDYLCGDMVSMVSLIEYDLSKTEGEYYLQTHSTNPLLTTFTINSAIEEFFRLKEYDSLFTVNTIQKRLYWPDGRPVNHDPVRLLRTQDLPPVFEENSCIYLFSKKIFNERKHRLGKNPKMFSIDQIEAIDIDEEKDFLLVEYFIKRRLGI